MTRVGGHAGSMRTSTCSSEQKRFGPSTGFNIHMTKLGALGPQYVTAWAMLSHVEPCWATPLLQLGSVGIIVPSAWNHKIHVPSKQPVLYTIYIYIYELKNKPDLGSTVPRSKTRSRSYQKLLRCCQNSLIKSLVIEHDWAIEEKTLATTNREE